MPAQGRGPFYPIQKPLDQDNDLTVVQDKKGAAHRGGCYILHEQYHLLNSIREPDERKRLMVALQPPPPSLEPASRVGVFNLVLNPKG